MSSFILDSYTFSRGKPTMLDLHCAYCGAHLITYQKDGPGPLKRCYLDRIHSCKTKGPEDDHPEILKRNKCSKTIGDQYIYEKEQRPAYKLLEGSFIIKI